MGLLHVTRQLRRSTLQAQLELLLLSLHSLLLLPLRGLLVHGLPLLLLLLQGLLLLRRQPWIHMGNPLTLRDRHLTVLARRHLLLLQQLLLSLRRNLLLLHRLPSGSRLPMRAAGIRRIHRCARRRTKRRQRRGNPVSHWRSDNADTNGTTEATKERKPIVWHHAK